MAEPQQERNARVIEEFRGNAGVVGGQHAGIPLLLLHHTGARSGAHRITPLTYQEVGDGFIVFATNGGRHDSPAWLQNLIADARAEVEIGGARVPVEARVLDGAERDGVWARAKQRQPMLLGYEAATSRRIPVVMLHPIDDDDSPLPSA